MYFSSLVVGCVCVLCSTQRENLCCVPRPFYIYYTREKGRRKRGERGWWCLCVLAGVYIARKCGWIGRLGSHTEKEEKKKREERWRGDLSIRKINGRGGYTILSRVPWWMLPCRDLWLSVSSTWHGTRLAAPPQFPKILFHSVDEIYLDFPIIFNC